MITREEYDNGRGWGWFRSSPNCKPLRVRKPSQEILEQWVSKRPNDLSFVPVIFVDQFHGGSNHQITDQWHGIGSVYLEELYIGKL